MSSLIDESLKAVVMQRFTNMIEPVTLKVFSSKNHCLFCNEMISLVNAVGELSDKISVEICNCDEDDPKAKKYGIERHPAIAIDGDDDYGIRFYGVPAGKEFTTFVESIMLVSSRKPVLSPEAEDLLKKVTKKVNLKVFVTLECPYCPAMVLRAHKLALANDNITAEMIESSQFAQLAADFDIFGVPNTIINNGNGSVEGLVTEEVLLNEILRVLEQKGEKSPFT
ncbi:MAG: thioredoxin family protein [Candidatus Heimdallarchaeota archaeon]|nr:thioredoxin family protein [Candidatus Heimdallarchaeota archaeon]MBY8993687.1 thioredoxin family protein [Candidatus Heimdallarchaeota archaeon]